MGEADAILAGVGALREQVELQTEATKAQNEKLDQQAGMLQSVRSRGKWMVVVLALLGLTLGYTTYSNHQTTCGVHGILIQARTASLRNPVPADLPPEQKAFVEAQREQASEFYADALDGLTLLWGCSGEHR